MRHLVGLVFIAGLLFGGVAWARILVQSGVIIENNAPVAGAEVTIGSSTSTTDESGAFDINAVGGPAEITVTLPTRPGVTYKGPITIAGMRVVVDLAKLTAEGAGAGEVVDVVLGTFVSIRDALAVMIKAKVSAPSLFLVDEGSYALSIGRKTTREEAAAAASAARDAGFSAATVYSAKGLLAPVAVDPNDPAADQAAAKALLLLLDNDNETIRRSARAALGNLGAVAVQPLLALSGGGNYRNDIGALVALSRIAGWSAPRDVVARLGSVAMSYNDPTISATFADAVRSLAVADKLSLLNSGATSVAEFQQQVGLPDDGVVGPTTGQALADAVIAAIQRGVTDEPDAKIDIRAWGLAPPTVAWCYQEDRLTPGPNRYSAHCHWSEDRCLTAKGGKGVWVNTDCALTSSLDKSGWNPTPKGFMGSWFTFAEIPLPAPFPQLPQ